MQTLTAKQKQTVRSFKKNGFDVETGCQRVGFLFNHLGSAQKTYQFIKNANKYLAENFSVSINAFIDDVIPPCIGTHFGIFPSSAISTFHGSIVSTTIADTIAAKRCVRSNKFYYIFDPEWLLPGHKIDLKNVKAILTDDTIIKFVRSKDLRTKLVDQGYNIHEIIVPSFELTSIMEIINDNR